MPQVQLALHVRTRLRGSPVGQRVDPQISQSVSPGVQRVPTQEPHAPQDPHVQLELHVRDRDRVPSLHPPHGWESLLVVPGVQPV
ncbi:MAG TPA: hypothetical protein VIL20_14690 [Sandaracinaceae bacterium]